MTTYSDSCIAPYSEGVRTRKAGRNDAGFRARFVFDDLVPGLKTANPAS